MRKLVPPCWIAHHRFADELHGEANQPIRLEREAALGLRMVAKPNWPGA